MQWPLYQLSKSLVLIALYGVVSSTANWNWSVAFIHRQLAVGCLTRQVAVPASRSLPRSDGQHHSTYTLHLHTRIYDRALSVDASTCRQVAVGWLVGWTHVNRCFDDHVVSPELINDWILSKQPPKDDVTRSWAIGFMMTSVVRRRRTSQVMTTSTWRQSMIGCHLLLLMSTTDICTGSPYNGARSPTGFATGSPEARSPTASIVTPRRRLLITFRPI